jgi:hypothetical protein
MKVSPCVIMVEARDLVQKANNTMPKEIWCDSSNTNFDKGLYCGYWCFEKWITLGQNLKRLGLIL